MARPKLETTPFRSRLMRRVRRANTPAEVCVRQELTCLGLGYRLHAHDLPGTPDIVNRKGRWAIFVHGCYWHAHEGCPRWRLPKRNRDFWVDKFQANRERDVRKIEQLENLGYRVLVVWECETVSSFGLREKLERFLRWMDVLR